MCTYIYIFFREQYEEQPSRLQVIAGHRGFLDQTEFPLIPVSEILIHPDYDPRSYYHNVALLHLGTRLQFGPLVAPICLPNEEATPDDICMTTGWNSHTIGTACTHLA